MCLGRQERIRDAVGDGGVHRMAHLGIVVISVRSGSLEEEFCVSIDSLTKTEKWLGRSVECEEIVFALDLRKLSIY